MIWPLILVPVLGGVVACWWACAPRASAPVGAAVLVSLGAAGAGRGLAWSRRDLASVGRPPAPRARRHRRRADPRRARPRRGGADRRLRRQRVPGRPGPAAPHRAARRLRRRHGAPARGGRSPHAAHRLGAGGGVLVGAHRSPLAGGQAAAGRARGVRHRALRRHRPVRRGRGSLRGHGLALLRGARRRRLRDARAGSPPACSWQRPPSRRRCRSRSGCSRRWRVRLPSPPCCTPPPWSRPAPTCSSACSPRSGRSPGSARPSPPSAS